MYQPTTITRSALQETGPRTSDRASIKPELSASARLVDGRIEVEARTAHDHALIAQTMIVLPKAMPARNHEPDPAYPTGFYYPV